MKSSELLSRVTLWTHVFFKTEQTTAIKMVTMCFGENVMLQFNVKYIAGYALGCGRSITHCQTLPLPLLMLIRVPRQQNVSKHPNISQSIVSQSFILYSLSISLNPQNTQNSAYHCLSLWPDVSGTVSNPSLQYLHLILQNSNSHLKKCEIYCILSNL